MGHVVVVGLEVGHVVVVRMHHGVAHRLFRPPKQDNDQDSDEDYDGDDYEDGVGDDDEDNDAAGGGGLFTVGLLSTHGRQLISHFSDLF